MAKRESKIKARKRAIQNKAQKKQRIVQVVGIIGMLILATAVFTRLAPNNINTESPPADLATAPEIGALAPDFELPDKNGESIRLSDYRGQPVVVNFMHTW